MKKYTSPLDNECGFSLLENMTSITVIGISLAALLLLYSKMSTGSLETSLLADETLIAQNQMEQIISDFNNSAKGYPYVRDVRHYPQTQSGFYSLTTTVDTTNHVRNNVSYIIVSVKAANPSGSANNSELKMWFIKQ